MALRVLHIFAPNFRQRFGGPIYNWQFYFSKWDEPAVTHLVLDSEAGRILAARDAFDFEPQGEQHTSSRWERLTWALRLQKYLRQYRGDYDLLHFHLIWWGSLLEAAWAKRKGIPAIYESVLLDSDTPGAMRDEKLGGLKLRFLKQFAGILAISDGIAEDYYKHGFAHNQVHMQMNCLDTALFRPARSLAEKRECRLRFGLPEDAKVCLFVGSLIWRKGVDLLMDAFITALEQDPHLFLWLVGPKSRQENPTLDEDFVRGIQDKVTEQGLGSSVQFEGIVSDRAVLAVAYRAADLFVFPSRKEGLPNVVLEAMASGVPVVVSQLPGLKNVIRSGENGVMIDNETENSLASAMGDVCHNPAAAANLAQHARKYILEHHSFAAWQRQLTAYYQELVGRKDN